MIEGLKVFENSEFGKLGILEVDGKLMFPATRCAALLGYKDVNKAVKQHCKEDGWAIHPVIDSLGREQKMKFITEGNLYRLIAKSKLPQAEQFERWVFDEVIPQIRQTGGYIPVKEEESDEEIMAKASLVAKKTLDKKEGIIKLLQQKIIEQEGIVQSYNRMIASDGLFNMKEVAQLLDFEIGRNKLFAFLRDKNVLDNYNLPYEVHRKTGRFKVKVFIKDGRMVTATLVTPKGIDYINRLIMKNGRYKPCKEVS
ncbi:phage antirepressor KilAC domain-containing protein [Peribacillus simplex]|uniref:phage antirepressor KilAC domain-containing protein n=1 Tax=Peribacillus simplex TaxID=1478 RepID=UPI001628D8CA|nr:phage antirepressor KilAC domain-containing protein [Peribacillus simplex]